MGECGCASEEILFKFPGPEGITYGFEVYDSCHYCGTPAAAVIYRVDADGKHPDIGEDLMEHVPEIEFKSDFCVAQVAVPVVEPAALFRALGTTVEVDEDGYAEGMFDRQDVAYVLPQAVRESLKPFHDLLHTELTDNDALPSEGSEA